MGRKVKKIKPIPMSFEGLIKKVTEVKFLSVKKVKNKTNKKNLKIDKN